MPERENQRWFRRRLAENGWVTAAVLAVLAGAVLIHGLPASYAIAGGALVIVAAFLAPRRRARFSSPAEMADRLEKAADSGLELAVDSMPSAALVVDGRGVIRHLNRLAVDWFGNIRPGEPLALKMRLPELLEAFDTVVSEGRRQTIQWIDRGTAERRWEIHISPMGRPGMGSLRTSELYLLVAHDLTEQHRLERMRADFVANASHELRTPLASLTGFIETLQGHARDDPAARERFLDVMLEQANRMARLIGDLLSLSRIEMRSHVRPETVVDLGDILRHTADALRPLAGELEVTIEMAVEPGPFPVNGDRDELVQVFDNLVENGLKYGGSGGRLEIGLRHDDENGKPAFLAWVRDWGPGIATEHQPRLTERFYRVDVETSRQNKGTGLGLAIVKHILTRHRARLNIHSKPGEGASFKVRFEPASEPEEVNDQNNTQ